MRKNLNNLQALGERRKQLRGGLTPAEAFLWRLLKNRQLEGRRFRRQFSVGKYILDFYCPEENLAIELDGAHHFTEEGMLEDKLRDEFLNTQGIFVLRIENKGVFDNTTGTLHLISSHFKKQ
ncbi:MAG: endonuclease domain-containing protein [Bacteroidia bacterium]